MLYQVTFDRDQDYIEARSFGEAVTLWQREMQRQNGDDSIGDEQPESVALMSEKPVIRDLSAGEA